MELGTLDGPGDARVDLLNALHGMTCIARLPLHRVPPMVPLLTQQTGTRGYWAGEGAARRPSVGTYARDSLRLKPVAGVAVASVGAGVNPPLFAGEVAVLE
jgi:hypothetical protein